MTSAPATDGLAFKAWRFAWHVMCVVLVAMGTLHVIGISLWLIVQLVLIGDSFAGVMFKLAWIGFAVLFVWMGLQGLRIRSPRDLEEQLSGLDDRRNRIEA